MPEPHFLLPLRWSVLEESSLAQDNSKPLCLASVGHMGMKPMESIPVAPLVACVCNAHLPPKGLQ
jgi:hypothetical protein